MHLKHVRISGLGGRTDCEFTFHRDINVITGINGSGKTTLLKLLWYLISGNIERIIPEIDFREVYLSTSAYDIWLSYDKRIVEWKFMSPVLSQAGRFQPGLEMPSASPEDLNRLVMELGLSSLYFPTFRRIEGGYSMANTRRSRRRLASGEVVTEMVEHDEFQSGFDELSQRISVGAHRFVCSISTHDIVHLLTARYATASEAVNETYRLLSTSIIEKIEGAKTEISEDREKAYRLLSAIQTQADEVNKTRDALLRPFSVLSSLTVQFFRHKGIRARSVTLGESVDAIDSGVLSAGEKQMLSFLCYNAFYEQAPIFIDEPELSLHPDWQRRLFPTLLRQQSSNQFIIATHSPFIYAKYQDKELSVAADKGE